MPALRAAALAAAALVLLPATAAADTTLGTVPSPTPVTASGTTVAWSAYDPATNTYALTVSVNGQVQTPPVATRTVPFDVDAGQGPDGATWLVYSRCATEAQGGRGAKGCDLYGYSLAGGATERKLAASGSGSETEPAISGNRVAFARGGVVYTGAVTGSGSARPVRGAVPSRTCETVGDRCVRIRRPQVQGLDLAGNRVAAVSYWDSTGGQAVGIGQSALVVAPVAGAAGKATAVAFTVVGMNGQSLLGPSFAGNAVGWFYGCPGYVGGCGGPLAGSWTYSLSSKRSSLATSRAAVLGYAALPNRQAVEVIAGAGEGCGIGEPTAAQPCTIVQAEGLRYAAAKKRPVPVRLAR
jgi:hypothetical protein